MSPPGTLSAATEDLASVGNTLGTPNPDLLVVCTGATSVEIGLIESGRLDVKKLTSLFTPPGPTHVRPVRQQPYSPLEPRLQYVPTAQPPARSGQQVSVRSMQEVPQSFMPCCEHGIREPWRLRTWREALVRVEVRRRMREMYMIAWCIGVFDSALRKLTGRFER